MDKIIDCSYPIIFNLCCSNYVKDNIWLLYMYNVVLYNISYVAIILSWSMDVCPLDWPSNCVIHLGLSVEVINYVDHGLYLYTEWHTKMKPPPSYASDIDIMIWYVDCTKAFRNKAEGERYESQEPSACVFISYLLFKGTIRGRSVNYGN